MNPWGFLVLAAITLWVLLATLERVAVFAWYAPIERAQGKMNVATLSERRALPSCSATTTAAPGT